MGTIVNESRVSNVRRAGDLAIGGIETRPVPKYATTVACALLCATFICPANGQANGVGQKPFLGWSTFSEQTIVRSSSVMNEQNILAQSDAMRASGLGAHGFQYINLDAGWSGDSDPYGRTLPRPTSGR